MAAAKFSIAQRLKTAPVSVQKFKKIYVYTRTSQINTLYLNILIWTDTITDHVLASQEETPGSDFTWSNKEIPGKFQ